MNPASLNYHHLMYFWTVARCGGVSRAAEELRVSQPSISTQVHQLEEHFGYPLFERRGRHLALTEKGRMVKRFADQIFTLGRELQETAAHWEETPGRFVVGVSQVIPKLMAQRLIEPALGPALRLVCREGRVSELVAALALHEVDVVLSDEPVDPRVRVRSHAHLLVDSPVSVFGVPKFADVRRGFPRSLDGVPLLLPTEASVLRSEIDAWLDAEGLHPRVVGEFDDSALLKAFARRGAGVFLSPSVIEAEVCEELGVVVLGTIEQVRERFYAISLERRLRHPAVVAIVEAAGAAASSTGVEPG